MKYYTSKNANNFNKKNFILSPKTVDGGGLRAKWTCSL